MRRFYSAIPPLVLVLAGCRGDMVTSVDVTSTTTAEKTFSSDGKQLAVWAELHSAKWKGDSPRPPVSYDLELLQDGKSVAQLHCPLVNGGSRVCSNSSCEYSLDCTVPSIPAGDVTVRVKLERENLTSADYIVLNVRRK